MLVDWSSGFGVEVLGAWALISYGASLHCAPVCTSTVSMHGILGCGQGSYFHLVGETLRHIVIHSMSCFFWVCVVHSLEFLGEHAHARSFVICCRTALRQDLSLYLKLAVSARLAAP